MKLFNKKLNNKEKEMQQLKNEIKANEKKVRKLNRAADYDSYSQAIKIKTEIIYQKILYNHQINTLKNTSMKPFKIRLDSEKNYLRIEFDPKNKQYVYFYGEQQLEYTDLNKKTCKKLDLENQKLMESPELLNQEIKIVKRKAKYKYLKSKGIELGSFQVASSKIGTMSTEMESFLNSLTSKENSLIGIHRTGFASIENIYDALKNGILLTGDSGYGVSSSEVNINRNLSFYEDNKKIIQELMAANLYKNSKGSLLIEIPESNLNENLYIIDKNGNPRLNPKYIVGFVPVEENNHISKIITTEQLQKQSPTQTNSTPTIYQDIYFEESTFEEENPLKR